MVRATIASAHVGHCGLGSKPDLADPAVQRYPSEGALVAGMNWPVAALADRIGAAPSGPVYAYVLSSVSGSAAGFQQRGTAPNFQGGSITLCTCKHHMRSGRAAVDWPGCWVAGFTSVSVSAAHCHWLFYLMRVERAFESQFDLWQALPRSSREAKAADRHPLGDLYRPLSDELAGGERFQVARYQPPCPSHDHYQGWEDDVHYPGGRRPALLVGAAEHSYVWSGPMVRARPEWRLGRGHRRLSGPTELMDRLEGTT